MSLLQTIGQFFAGLFNAMKRAYNNLPEEDQNALQIGVGLMAILNENVAATPAKLRELIHAKFPELDEAAIETALFKVAQRFGLADKYNNLDDLFKILTDHIDKIEGKDWAEFSHGAALTISVIFARPEAKLSSLVFLLEWVYQHFIKKSIA